MIYTKYEKDWIIIDESNYETMKEKRKIHLIKLDFKNPNKDKVNTVLNNFPSTNRYIISNNIRFYNYFLKSNKKYYVENLNGNNFISFLRKNNKILLNFLNLDENSKSFLLYNFHDILKNVEVICLGDKENITIDMLTELENWDGNVLIW